MHTAKWCGFMVVNGESYWLYERDGQPYLVHPQWTRGDYWYRQFRAA